MGLISRLEKPFFAAASILRRRAEVCAGPDACGETGRSTLVIPRRQLSTVGTKQLNIRAEMAADEVKIDAVLRESFPTDVETRLVERLRSDGDAVMSLVAEVEGRIAAYVMYSKMTAPFRALGLGPVATATAARKQGLASALIVEGLGRARASGWEACFVLGNPRFYGRFGFSVELARGFDCAYAGPSFMAMGLQEAGMPARTGRVVYAKAFG